MRPPDNGDYVCIACNQKIPGFVGDHAPPDSRICPRCGKFMVWEPKVMGGPEEERGPEKLY